MSMCQRLNFVHTDKTDSSFSRSHSSSMTSLENVNKEAIECLVFADAYTRKSGMFFLFHISLMNWRRRVSYFSSDGWKWFLLVCHLLDCQYVNQHLACWLRFFWILRWHCIFSVMLFLLDLNLFLLIMCSRPPCMQIDVWLLVMSRFLHQLVFMFGVYVQTPALVLVCHVGHAARSR